MIEFEKFGDAITLDHVDANSEMLRSYDGDRDLLVLYDLATGCIGAYPVKSKGANEVLESLVHFAGVIRFGRCIPTEPQRLLQRSGACQATLLFTRPAYPECRRRTLSRRAE